MSNSSPTFIPKLRLMCSTYKVKRLLQNQPTFCKPTRTLEKELRKARKKHERKRKTTIAKFRAVAKKALYFCYIKQLKMEAIQRFLQAIF